MELYNPCNMTVFTRFWGQNIDFLFYRCNIYIHIDDLPIKNTFIDVDHSIISRSKESFLLIKHEYTIIEYIGGYLCPIIKINL